MMRNGEIVAKPKLWKIQKVYIVCLPAIFLFPITTSQHIRKMHLCGSKNSDMNLSSLKNGVTTRQLNVTNENSIKCHTSYDIDNNWFQLPFPLHVSTMKHKKRVVHDTQTP